MPLPLNPRICGARAKHHYTNGSLPHLQDSSRIVLLYPCRTSGHFASPGTSASASPTPSTSAQ